jgi:cytochrome c oxidase subunit 1
VKAQPVDIYKFFGDAGLDGFNLAASIGAFVLAIGILLELGNAAYSYRNGVRAGHDPWRGATLEWFTLSPPPEHNFDAVPDVRSAEPLRDIRRAIQDRTASWRPPPPPEPAEPPASEPEPVEAASTEEAGGEGTAGGAPVA